MAALLETYEQQYAVLTADITSKIGRIANLSSYAEFEFVPTSGAAMALSSLSTLPLKVDQILEYSLVVLQEQSGLSLERCRQLKEEAACPRLSVKPLSGHSALMILSTGCNSLDDLLGGGLRSRGITEVVGAAGCGKTQLCLQLCLTVQQPRQLNGFGTGALYITSEGPFPVRRLLQMSSAFKTSTNLVAPLDQVFVRQANDREELLCCLGESATLLAARPIRLIVIDSVAGVFRTDLEGGAGDRAEGLRAVAKQLQTLSERFNAVVLCVNQVADAASDTGVSSLQVPALGLTWTNLLRTRLWLSRISNERFAEVAFSPEVASGVKLRFSITEFGIKPAIL